MIRALAATKYITPLREGGSLPAIVEAEDGQLYVMKFVGAGQGAKALIAELVAGEVARALGLAVPEIAFMQLDPALGRTEADPEIRDLIRASAGLNLALRYLPKAFAFSPLLRPAPEASLASAIVWFDAYVTNVDRTARNTNLLLWQRDLWLIDHGAALYFHHANGWTVEVSSRSQRSFPMIRDHVLLPFASALLEVEAGLRERLTRQRLEAIVAAIPESWLEADQGAGQPALQRAAYVTYLTQRLELSPGFVEEAVRARSKL